MHKILSLLLVFLSLIGNAQKTKTAQPIKNTIPAKPALIACDCKNAVKININKATTYGPTQPTSGFGSVQEITTRSKGDKFNFEKEHNSAWYLLTVNFNGEFVFEITPSDTSNDYDFLLYKYTDSNFCDVLRQKQVKPVRSNLSRDNAQIKGLTGLSTKATNEFIGPGVGQSWSKSVRVTKGDKYILVLDNVYPEGLGHVLKFNYIKEVTIAGTALGGDNKPLKAEVLLSDNEGNTVYQGSTGADGKYSIAAELKEDVNYTVVFTSDSAFFATSVINTKEMSVRDTALALNPVLPKLKKGQNYKINSINFYGDASTLLPESYSSVDGLYQMMKKNKNMVIRIEGHINAPKAKTEDARNQKLSELRATTVYDYLIEKGIEKERMSTIGYSGKKMIYPNAKNEKEASANRRVEINILSLN